MHNEFPKGNELQQVAWACFDYWSREKLSIDQRAICYKWVERTYKARFGDTFHQSKLGQLERLGILVKGDTSRAGHRRYYRINDPARVAEFLKTCNPN
jgi:hypothetical protein